MSASVVGLDLSITATGIAYPDGSTLTVRPVSDGDRRLVEIHTEVRAAVTAADLVVIEDLPTHARAAGITGMVHGVVRRMLIARGQSYVLITPATLKKFATGKGTADKTAMTLALYKRFTLELPDDNQVDAWWLRAAGRELLGDPIFPLPAAQVAVLDKVRAAMGGAS